MRLNSMKPDATNDALFICPVCQAALTRVDKTFVCENRHCFDIAKEGYVNLLPVQKKKSISPGDNNVMIKSRKDFLDKHYYDMLIAPCANIINQLIAERFEHCMLLDVGCGNGFFTRHIYNQLAHDVCCYGMDISKTAVRSSAKSERLIHWFVASSNDIPLQNNCIDIMLKINAPLNYQKSREKLSDNGLVISVTPGESHLN
ncbi:MAG TPA: methyltransferase domain-containing protein, partial [Gammaproteobacteria bacterium]|nr:methyltransferase domain-containing protein [Gammaproteobacteria bacterium]